MQILLKKEIKTRDYGGGNKQFPEFIVTYSSIHLPDGPFIKCVLKGCHLFERYHPFLNFISLLIIILSAWISYSWLLASSFSL